MSLISKIRQYLGLYILAVLCTGKEVMSCGQLTSYDTRSFTDGRIIFRAIVPIAVGGKHLIPKDGGNTTLEISLFTFWENYMYIV